jgi:hypothetical protein
MGTPKCSTAQTASRIVSTQPFRDNFVEQTPSEKFSKCDPAGGAFSSADEEIAVSSQWINPQSCSAIQFSMAVRRHLTVSGFTVLDFTTPPAARPMLLVYYF